MPALEVQELSENDDSNVESYNEENQGYKQLGGPVGSDDIENEDLSFPRRLHNPAELARSLFTAPPLEAGSGDDLNAHLLNTFPEPP